MKYIYALAGLCLTMYGVSAETGFKAEQTYETITIENHYDINLTIHCIYETLHDNDEKQTSIIQQSVRPNGVVGIKMPKTAQPTYLIIENTDELRKTERWFRKKGIKTIYFGSKDWTESITQELEQISKHSSIQNPREFMNMAANSTIIQFTPDCCKRSKKTQTPTPLTIDIRPQGSIQSYYAKQ